MYTVSSILKQNREQRGFTQEEVAKRTKIPTKYIKAFEEENYKAYPDEPYCSLHIKNYAIFLDLRQDNILALFRRDYATYQKNSSMPRPVGKEILTPQRVFKLSVIAILFFFIGYILLSYLQFSQPPSLVVSWPAKEQTASSVKIVGTTSEDAVVRINRDLVVVRDGSFSKEIFLNTGENLIIIEAKGRNGKEITSTYTIQKI